MNKESLKGPNWSKGLITAAKTVPICDYNTDYKVIIIIKLKKKNLKKYKGTSKQVQDEKKSETVDLYPYEESGMQL